MTASRRVWDLPTRLSHWLIAALFFFSWWSAENREMEWHYRSGICLLGLLAFRLLWGFVGGSTARFASMLHSPRAVLAYLRAKAGPARAGHNPLGGYSALALLALLGAQIAFGLFATDVDGLESGPLSFLVSFDGGRIAADWHHLSFDVLLALVVLHGLAVLFYLVVRKRNLLPAMITGRDRALDAGGQGLRPAAWWTFLACAIAAGLFAWATSIGYGM